MFGGRLGAVELILILVVALVIFGPAKLPEIGKALGKSLKEFKKETSNLMGDGEVSESKKKNDQKEEKTQETTADEIKTKDSEDDQKTNNGQ